jgi:predicted metalloprotease
MRRSSSYKHRPYKFKYYNFMKSRIGAVTVISSVIVVVVIMFLPHFIRSTHIVTITNKQVINRNNIDKYFIYTQTEEGNIKVYENTDNFLELKFNSKDLYWGIAINKKYEVRAYGLNIPLFSSYQNIIKVKGIEN